MAAVRAERRRVSPLRLRHDSGMTDGSVGAWGFGSPVIDPSSAWSPSFAALVTLMIHGPGSEDRIRGEVRAAIIEERLVQFRYRVARRGELVRCETLDGGIYVIAGRDTVWLGDPNTGRLRVHPRPQGYTPAPDDFEFGCARPTDDQWTGDDFTIPTGPEAAVTFLGRAAWSVELAPPPHKPFPMQLVIDADTGLILREGNDALGSFHEWAELDPDADLPDGLFTFDPDSDVLADPLPR